jgi:hypothetical protein
MRMMKNIGLLLVGLAFSVTLLNTGPPVSVSKTELALSNATTSIGFSFAGSHFDLAFLVPNNEVNQELTCLGYIVLNDAKPDNTIINGILHEQERIRGKSILLI